MCKSGDNDHHAGVARLDGTRLTLVTCPMSLTGALGATRAVLTAPKKSPPVEAVKLRSSGLDLDLKVVVSATLASLCLIDTTPSSLASIAQLG